MKDILTPVMQATAHTEPNAHGRSNVDRFGALNYRTVLTVGGRKFVLTGYQNQSGMIRTNLYDFNDGLECTVIAVDSDIPGVIDMIPTMIRHAAEAYAESLNTDDPTVAS